MLLPINKSNFNRIGKRCLRIRKRDWSTMQDDIIRLIVEKLGFYVHHRKFAAACVDWYRITKEIHGTFQENSLFLLLPFNYETKTCSLYQMSNSKTLEFSLPDELQDKFVHGSSNGWLAVADDNFQLSLINPLTCKKIPLPMPSYAVASLEECNRDMHNPFFRSYLMSKFVLSEGNSLSRGCLVAAIMSTVSKLFICRLGDDSLSRARGYLAKCSEDLLLVYKIAEYHTETTPYKTLGFEVYRFEQNEGTWSRIHELGEHSLFVGRNESIAVSSEDLPDGCKSNCIYFADDYTDGQGGETPFGYQFDNGAFSLSDGSLEMLHISHSMTHWVCSPFWYQQKM